MFNFAPIVLIYDSILLNLPMQHKVGSELLCVGSGVRLPPLFSLGAMDIYDMIPVLCKKRLPSHKFLLNVLEDKVLLSY